MFKALQSGKKIRKKVFEEQSQDLRQALLEAQFDLVTRDYPVIILVAGLDGSGKGPFIHRLNEWMDPRLIETHAFWEISDEEESRPHYWRFWRYMPPNGRMGIFIGSWYTAPVLAELTGESGENDLARACHQIQITERMLSDAGAVIVKLYFYVSRETQQMQLKQEAPRAKQIPRVPASAEFCAKTYDKHLEVAERVILATDASYCPWHLVEAEDANYRDITASRIILQAMQSAAQRNDSVTNPPPAATPRTNGLVTNGLATVLDNVDLQQSLEKDEYRDKLEKFQDRLQDLAWEAYGQRRSLIAVFEGWDAAGKGSAIRRVTQAMDPRLFKLVQYAAPTDEEKAQHYLWRFWRKLQRDGRATLFDRSWYGRVLVERVEQLATEEEWRRAFSEINLFEWQMHDHGWILVKFWLHISPEEQLRRFRDREQIPYKQHKITEEDWRNREQWDDYKVAVDEMVTRTSTSHAPWTLVAGDDKRFARIQILKTLCRALEAGLG